MDARNWARPLPLLLTSLLAMAGCASTGAPDGWLPPATEAPSDPYGSWMMVEFTEPHEGYMVMGEFLAIGQDSLYVLSGSGPVENPISAIHVGIVKKAQIAHFDPGMGAMIGWVTAGSISSLSHGMGAAITLPLWAIMGSTIAAGHSRSPLENYPDVSWRELRKFARFPQGPPPDLHRLGLRPKNPEFQKRGNSSGEPLY